MRTDEQSRFNRDTAGVSPVIATILLVAMTIVMTSGLALWMQGFVPTEKSTDIEVKASVQQEENGDFYIFITSVSDDLGVEDVEYRVQNAAGFRISPPDATLASDEVYGTTYIDGDQNGYLSSSDFFVVRSEAHGGLGEVGGRFELYHLGSGQMVLSTELR